MRPAIPGLLAIRRRQIRQYERFRDSGRTVALAFNLHGWLSERVGDAIEWAWKLSRERGNVRHRAFMRRSFIADMGLALDEGIPFDRCRLSGRGRTGGAYSIAMLAIEDGFDHGWMRAHKHSSRPSMDTVVNEIALSTMTSLAEVVDFERSAVAR